MKRPRGLTDEQLRTLMTVTRALAPRHRCWLLAAVIAELDESPRTDINSAINSALTRLGREVAA
jgi:hypothetical protein